MTSADTKALLTDNKFNCDQSQTAQRSGGYTPAFKEYAGHSCRAPAGTLVLIRAIQRTNYCWVFFLQGVNQWLIISRAVQWLPFYLLNQHATRAAEHKRPGHNEGSLVLIHRKSGHRLLPRITNISLAWEAGLQLIFELQPFHDFNVRVQLAKKGNVDK